MDLYNLIAVAIVCYTSFAIVGEILEQRKRETKTGEFEEEKEDE
jgi:hypothetical protein